jgi:antitoxin component YwqK of YwqJK toxin-antitoxin module
MFRLSVVLLVCSFINFNAFGQQKGVTYYDLFKKHPKEVFFKNSSGQFHGSYNAFYEDGTKWIEANYLNGELDGKYIEYSINGIAVIYNYKSGKKEGIQKGFRDAEGNLYKYFTEEEMFKDDNLMWVKHYKKEDGKVYKYLEQTYKDNKVVVTREYRSDGILWLQLSRDGINFKLYGPISFFRDIKCVSGEIENKIEYNTKDNIIDGFYREWHKNGNLKIECEFKNGNGDGQYTEYYSNGVLANDKSYKEGKLNGSAHDYDTLGVLISDGNYKDGLFTGYEKQVLNDTLITIHYTMGKIVSRAILNKRTNSITSIDTIDKLAIGNSFLIAKNYKAADSIFKIAVHHSIDKVPYNICIGIANLYALNKHYSKADCWYDSAIVKYGVLYDRIGRVDENYIKCKDFLDWIKCAFSGKLYERGFALLKKYAANNDRNAGHCYGNGADLLYARTYAEMNDTSNAREYYRKVLSKNDSGYGSNKEEYVESCRFLLTLADQQHDEYYVKYYAMAMFKSIPDDKQAKGLIDKYFPKRKDGTRKGISAFDIQIE